MTKHTDHPERQFLPDTCPRCAEMERQFNETKLQVLDRVFHDRVAFPTTRQIQRRLLAESRRALGK